MNILIQNLENKSGNESKLGNEIKSSIQIVNKYKNLSSSKFSDNSSKKGSNSDHVHMNKNQPQMSKFNSKKNKTVGLFDMAQSNSSRSTLPKKSDDLDKLDDDINPIEKVDQIDLFYGEELHNRVHKLKNTISIKSDDECRNQNNRFELGDNFDNPYKKMNEFMQKLNETIQNSNIKVDTLQSLQHQKRIVLQQIRQFEQAIELQISGINEDKKNYMKNKVDSQNSSYKNDIILRHLEEIVESKKETLKYIEENEQLIRGCNEQSKLCQQMGNTLYKFYSIIQEDINYLKNHNKNTPSKQDQTKNTESQEQLKIQLQQEQEIRKKLEEELNKRIIDFQQLLSDAQEAKKIIRDQLADIKEQKEKLKSETEEFDKIQKEFYKQNPEQTQLNYKLKDKDTDSIPYNKTTATNSQLYNSLKNKVQLIQQQHGLNDEINFRDNNNESGMDQIYKSRHNITSNNQSYLQSQKDEDDNSNSYLEIYKSNGVQTLRNNQTKYESGENIQTRRHNNYLNESKLQKSLSPLSKLIQALPQTSPNSKRLNPQLFDFKDQKTINDQNQYQSRYYGYNGNQGINNIVDRNNQSFQNITQGQNYSFGNQSVVNNNQNEPQKNNVNTLRNMIQQIQNQQNSLQQEISHYPIFNNQQL